jgi:glycosyltransferase involved in cell wall biosynthesis
VVVSRRVDFAPDGNPLTRLKYTSRIDCFIAVSRRVAEVLEASGVPRERVRTVYSGVPARARPDPARRATLRKELGLPDGAPVVGSVGALAAHKDPVTLVRGAAVVLRERPAARLLLVGDGPLRGEIEREARALGVADRVVLAGFRDDAIDCLSLLDVFAVTSRLEGLNTTVLDAMALGLPIVATRAGGIPEIVADNECGVLVPPGDPEALARALVLLLEDRQRAERFGAAARERSRSFTEERMVSETERVYRDVLAARAAASGRLSR